MIEKWKKKNWNEGKKLEVESYWYREKDIHVSLFENFEYTQILYNENKNERENTSSTENKENKKMKQEKVEPETLDFNRGISMPLDQTIHRT